VQEIETLKRMKKDEGTEREGQRFCDIRIISASVFRSLTSPPANEFVDWNGQEKFSVSPKGLIEVPLGDFFIQKIKPMGDGVLGKNPP
jgi:hypothetical protein